MSKKETSQGGFLGCVAIAKLSKKFKKSYEPVLYEARNIALGAKYSEGNWWVMQMQKLGYAN